MLECFVEAIVVFEFTDFDCWTNDDPGAVALEKCAQLISLRSRARYNDRNSLEWLMHIRRLSGVIVGAALRGRPSFANIARFVTRAATECRPYNNARASCLINVAASEAPIASAVSGGPDKDSCSRF